MAMQCVALLILAIWMPPVTLQIIPGQLPVIENLPVVDFQPELMRVAVAAASDTANISLECRLAYRLYTSATLSGQPWASKMSDADSKLPSGIELGKVQWLGSLDECHSVTANVTAATNDPAPQPQPYRGLYCQVDLAPANTSRSGGDVDWVGLPQLLNFGLCVPDVCSDTDLITNVNNAFNLTGLYPRVIYARDVLCQQTMDVTIDSKAIATIVVVAALVTVVLVGTIYDIFYHRLFGAIYSDVSHHSLTSNDATTSQGELAASVSGYSTSGTVPESWPARDVMLRIDDYTPLLRDHQSPASVGLKGGDVSLRQGVHTHRHPRAVNTIQNGSGHVSSLCSRFLIAASLYSNSKKLFAIPSPTTRDDKCGQQRPQLSCLHGVRFLSMAWIILGHTYLSSFKVIDNLIAFFDVQKEFSFQFVINGTFSVDTFFLLSGILVSYLTLNELDKGSERFNWFIFYFHRFWRLTPVYMILLAVNATLVKYLLSGPLWPRDDYERHCMSSWWTNLLYVNNFVLLDKQCFGWAWYLANDMQMYVVSPLFLLVLRRSSKLGRFILIMLVLVCVITTAVISAENDLPIESALNLSSPELGELVYNLLYIKPYVRMSPYLIGIYMGHLLNKCDGRPATPSKCSSVLGWLMSTALCTAVLYTPYINYTRDTPFTVAESAAYNALARTAWSIGVAWVIYACLTNAAGYVNAFLSWSVWIPLSRLTYCAYLVHPIIIAAYFYSSHTLIHLKHSRMIPIYLSMLFASYLTAYLVSMFFEAPMIGIEKLMFRKATRPTAAAAATTRKLKSGDVQAST